MITSRPVEGARMRYLSRVRIRRPIVPAPFRGAMPQRAWIECRALMVRGLRRTPRHLAALLAGALAQAGAVSGTSPAAGKAVFTGIGGCGSCHTLAAAGTTGTVGPNLDTRLKSDCASPQSKKVRGATLDKCIETAIVKPYAYIPSGYSSGVM